MSGRYRPSGQTVCCSDCGCIVAKDALVAHDRFHNLLSFVRLGGVAGAGVIDDQTRLR